MRRERLLPLLAMTTMSVLFGASFVGTKVGLGTFTPFQLLFVRFALAAVLFYAIAPWIKGAALDRGGYLRVLLLAVLEPGTYFFLEAAGIQRTQASTAAVLINTIPLMVLVLEVTWLKVRVAGREVLLILLSLAGVTLLVGAVDAPGAFGGSLLGNGLVLAAAVTASVYTLLVRRFLARYDAFTLTRLQTLFASLIYLPFAGWDWWKTGLVPPSGGALWSVLYLGAGCSFLAYWFLNYSLGRVKASTVAAFTNVIPVVATSLAVVVLKERLTPLQILGGLVVLTCITLLNVGRKAP